MSNLSLNFEQVHNKKIPSFCGVTDVLRKTYIRTYDEIVDEFKKDKAADGIAGDLPPYWLAKLSGYSVEEREIVAKKIMKAFRAAVKHLKPYLSKPSDKEYRVGKVYAENRRVKEASAYLTKVLRHFGVLTDTNTVYFHKLKSTGSFTKRTYALTEKGINPTLERLFVKIFRNQTAQRDYHGKYAELAHGLFLNNNSNSRHLMQLYWGDTKAGFLASEYLVPPRHVGPIVKLKKSYKNIEAFSEDFFKQTGIQLKELQDRNIYIGKVAADGTFTPASKDTIIEGLISSILKDINLLHTDLHDQNAIIGSKNGRALLKLIDIGGIISH